MSGCRSLGSGFVGERGGMCVRGESLAIPALLLLSAKICDKSLALIPSFGHDAQFIPALSLMLPFQWSGSIFKDNWAHRNYAPFPATVISTLIT